MPRIVYVHPDQTEQIVDIDDGVSVMRAAIVNGVDGIVGECGGQAMCATCHVFVQTSDIELPEIGEDEEEMLDCTAEARRDNSRLGCQLAGATAFNKIVVHLPESQV
ncbi:ferredoxin [Brevibacterium permense]|uniref:2Fe-2S iron-sulfur cluster-binding protein n=1 Tax=Brevibacterium permense TaxID=234834 RepID=UPI0021D34176|nr:2Fe-2S iron-sulfur cluster-binding protein [Brevibacterium permense]MCU4298789.1 ferredoxin [Brevibacterium permense]